MYLQRAAHLESAYPFRCLQALVLPTIYFLKWFLK